MVSFLPLNLCDEDSITNVLIQIDNAIQYGEDLDVREMKVNFQYCHLIILYKQVSIWHKNIIGYLSADIIFSKKQTVFWECSLRKTVSFKEQAMSKDKYPSIF